MLKEWEGLQPRRKQDGGAGCDSPALGAAFLPIAQVLSLETQQPSHPSKQGLSLVLHRFTSRHVRKMQAMTLPCFHGNHLLFQQPWLPDIWKSSCHTHLPRHHSRGR